MCGGSQERMAVCCAAGVSRSSSKKSSVRIGTNRSRRGCLFSLICKAREKSGAVEECRSQGSTSDPAKQLHESPSSYKKGPDLMVRVEVGAPTSLLDFATGGVTGHTQLMVRDGVCDRSAALAGINFTVSVAGRPPNLGR